MKGLTWEEARKRLRIYGRNEIKRIKKVSPIKIFLSQFTSPLVLILIGAAVLSFVIGYFPGQEPNIVDTILILSIVLASGFSGFFQEYKAEKTIEALQKMAAPEAKVIRDGKEVKLKISEIVPGDLILLEGGDIVPADSKLIEAFNLKVDESMLTGESQAVGKKVNDEVYMNTFVISGNGKAIVQKTGMRTKVGEIATKLQEIKEEKTPFQIEISKFSKKIFWTIILIAVFMMLIGLLKYNIYYSILTSISLAVAAIPEGLPAIITLSLAIGAKAMARKNSLVRKLSVIESVGSVDIICTDKTGTLTKNEMSVVKLFFNDKVIDAKEVKKDEIEILLRCGSLCNNSRICEGKYIGDQTEVAIRRFSDNLGIKKEELENEWKRINEISFTSERKLMSVIYKYKEKFFVFSKGAPEILIEKCKKIYENGKISELSKEKKEEILKMNNEFASHALRVLGFAFKELEEEPKEKIEEDLIWLGLEAMMDPPREEVKKAIEDCKTARIRVIMITGDNLRTAKAIANEIGLESKGAIEGKEIDEMNNEELEEILNSGVNIFARTSPFHKLRILEILKKNYRVAMTGDGVNDALALKKADVGIAMGIKGTEVAKEASDMILLDDNFATITYAVKEGRRIFDNIKKFVNYLFTCNFAEVAVLFIATLLFSFSEPILLPVQILWINLLTDGLPALALGVDPARPDIMREPPRKRNEPILNKRLMWLIGTIGTNKTIILLLTFFLTLPLGFEIARTSLFTGFILYECIRIGSIRYMEKLNWLSNKWLILALVISISLQLLILYSPLGVFFKIKSLGIYEWGILLTGTFIGYISAIGITKLVMKFT